MLKYSKLLELWNKSDEFRRLYETAHDSSSAVFGVCEAGAISLICAIMEKKPVLMLTQSDSLAASLCEELDRYTKSACFLPAREIQLTKYVAHSREQSSNRINALHSFLMGEKKILIASVEAAMQRIAPASLFKSNTITISIGDELELDEICKSLFNSGYERVDKVDAQGQFRQSGSIIDIYPPNMENPLRVELFDVEIDSIRSFDCATQRSIEKLEKANMAPAREIIIDENAINRAKAQLKAILKKQGDNKEHIEEILYKLDERSAISEDLLPFFVECESISNYMPDCLTIIFEPNTLNTKAKQVHDQFLEKFKVHFEQGQCLAMQERLLMQPYELWESLKPNGLIAFSTMSRGSNFLHPTQLFDFDVRDNVKYRANIEILAQDLQQYKSRKGKILIYAGSRAQKLCDDLNSFSVESGIGESLSRELLPGEILIIGQTIPRGYEIKELNLLILSETDIYGSHKRQIKHQKKKSVNKLDIFSDLKIGDYIVHESYGIGLFQGIETISADGVSRDYLKLHYHGKDKLYVPTDQLDRVQKFIGAKDRAPKLSRLGGGDWSKTVNKVRESVKELAFSLVELYAARQKIEGFAFSPDTPWQRQLEDSFSFEETQDQLQCIKEIKADMESPRVMDRLLCGDVGYGKTEVAVRAAFKACMDSKQVAVLAPTTVLAQQHYQTFTRRFSGFPISIGILSRFSTSKELKKTLERLKNGSIDVIIGTHKLLGKSIEFANLGLLVVDEEQRFGVGHKEFIKNTYKDVDSLTLSATPIPRTLHMSLVGIRDMSVLETPPEERFPVQTYVMEYTPLLVQDAIAKELDRGGQVFFLYNNVAKMEEMTGQIRKLIPGATIAMAHGKMGENQLEKTMMAFLNKEIDVLVCSTIIESGLDIPNVNTLIVYDADKLGLSQLYQLRGRVGRSNRLAYAYLTFVQDKSLSEIANERLKAIREFTDFGAGFKIALRDLEIRGAGNLVGAQQHGRIEEVGYDYYCKLIEQAIFEAKCEPLKKEIETQLDLTIDAHIDHSYISDEAQRLEIYKRIASISDIEDMYDVQEEIEDRFSDIPSSVQNLMNIALLKSLCERISIVQLSLTIKQIKMRFDEQASLDGAKLFDVLNGYKGAQLNNNSAVTVIIPLNEGTIEQSVSKTIELVQKLFICIE